MMPGVCPRGITWNSEPGMILRGSRKLSKQFSGKSANSNWQYWQLAKPLNPEHPGEFAGMFRGFELKARSQQLFAKCKRCSVPPPDRTPCQRPHTTHE